MSADLTWQLLRKNNSFLVKRDGALFSAEKNNLVNKHTYKFSGLANAKTVGVSMNKDKKIELSLKNPKAHANRRVSKLYSTYQLNHHMRSGECKGAKTIDTLTDKSFYRRDLSAFAIARYHALNNSKKAKKTINKRRPRGAKN